MAGTLIYGDNLDVLRRQPNETYDLIYLDPPFNSKRNYNLIHKGSKAQEQVFKDIWEWDDAAERAYDELTRAGSVAPPKLTTLIRAWRDVLTDDRDTLAYVTMMAVRLVEMHRVLKSTGSLYLHCDPTASHYLKVMLDAVFGTAHFQNEIVWQRTHAKALGSTRLASNHDLILAYRCGDEGTWNAEESFVPYDPADLDEKTQGKYSLVDKEGRRYQLTSLINPNPDRPNLTYEFAGITRVWRWTRDRMLAAYKAGQVVQTKPGAVPRYKRYLDEQSGKPMGDVWTDIAPVNARAKERLGYPTQKPVALLERILALATNAGDLVLDPFCGCGTTIEAADKLGRRWVGIDVADKAIDIIKKRLRDRDPDIRFREEFHPFDAASALRFAEQGDPYDFQWWCLRRLGAQPPGGVKKKGGDGGTDGEILVRGYDDQRRLVVVSVKSGKALSPEWVRSLFATVSARKAATGVLVTAGPATAGMRTLARDFGKVRVPSPGGELEVPRIQLVSVADFFDPKWKVELPGGNVTPKSDRPGAPTEQLGLFQSPKITKAKVPTFAVPAAPSQLEAAETKTPARRRSKAG